MEKRTLLAIAISIGILFLWTFLFPPPTPPPAPPQVPAAASETRPEIGEPAVPAPAPEIEATAPLSAEAVTAPSETEVSVSNGPYDVVLSNRGAVVRGWRLPGYFTGDGKPLELFPSLDSASLRPLALDVASDPGLTALLNDSLWVADREPVTGPEGREGERFRFRWSDGRGFSAEKSFVFWQNDWLIDVEFEVVDRGRRLDAALVLGPGFGAQESGNGKGRQYFRGAAVWNLAGEVTHLGSRDKTQSKSPSGIGEAAPLVWAGLEDLYFAALVVPRESGAAAAWGALDVARTPPPDGQPPEEDADDQATVCRVRVPSGSVQLFVGPKNFNLLAGLGHQLEESVWFSSYRPLAWVTRWLFFGLVWMHDHVAGNYGLAIILATLVLRILLFPVNQYSMVAMKKAQLQMQRLQPKIKAIKNKYKKVKDAESRAKMNQEMMELYRKEGVNPMGGFTGCLPLLAQFPILIGFYNMLTVAIELRGAPFLWIHDLSQTDPYWITPIAMAVTMFAQQKLAMSKIKDPQQLQQQKIMLFMPVFFGWLCLNMPAGMVLYWFVNNLLGIGQQWLVNRHTGRLEAAPQKA